MSDQQNGARSDGQDGTTSDGQDGAQGDRSNGSDPQHSGKEPNGSRQSSDSSSSRMSDRSNRSEGSPSANPSSWPQGGQPGTGSGSFASDYENHDNADAANLEYARKATELVLEYLRKQQDEPDPDLLNKLGWTKEDLQKFIERWEKLKREADEPSVDQDAARNKLEELLRGLGLQPERDRVRQDRYTTQRTEVTESGQRSSPPDEYAEQYRAFLRGRQP